MINRLDLDELEKKVIKLLEEYKDPLIQILRGWDESWFVPTEIEIPVKHIIKNYHSISIESTYFHESSKSTIQRKKDNRFLITPTNTSLVHEVTINRKSTPREKFGSYWEIHHQGKTYEEMDLSGNTYNHIMSQAEKLNEWTEIDIAAGLLSLEEAQMIRIRNYFHDMPEYKKGDTIASSKTDEQRKEEDVIADLIIDEQDRSEEEKDIMKQISKLHIQNGLFKLYEIMFYVYDIYHLIEKRAKHNNSPFFAAAMLGYQFPRLLNNYQLPDGRIMYGLDVASCVKNLKENISIVENAFDYSDKNGVTEYRKPSYVKIKETRENIIKPYITKEKQYLFRQNSPGN